MEDFPHPVPQHRRTRPDLRSYNGSDVRSGRISVDCVRHHFRRCGPRLSVRDALAPKRRRVTAGDCRCRTRVENKDCDARVRPVADDSCGRGFRLQSRRPAGNAHSEQSRQDVLDRSDFRLLYARHPSPYRQTYRQTLPIVRNSPALHGFGNNDHALRARAADAGNVGGIL